MADATDLKSVGTSMRVRVPPRALYRINEENGTKRVQKHAEIKKKLQKTFFFLADAQ